MDGLNKEIADNASFGLLDHSREQWSKEFNAEGALNSIEFLGGAIENLGAHHRASMLEIPNRVAIAEIPKHEMAVNAAQYEGIISPSPKM